jgi:hypothetical protein
MADARKMVTLMKWLRNNINNAGELAGNLAAGKNAILAALLSLAFLMMPTAARAQSWSGLLDPSRAIDWRQVGGVTLTIPSGGWSQCTTAACNTVTSAGTTATAAQINAAIASAPANTFVKLGSGIFTLTNCLSWAGHSHVVLRGNGPTNTILKFTGSGCGGFSGNTMIQLQAASNSYDQNAGNMPGGSNSLSITGTTGCTGCGTGLYPKGATQITVANVGSDTPHVGTMLIIDQANDTALAPGWLQCAVNTAGSACSENGNNNGRKIGGVNYEQVQVVRVTNISGSTYTITPGLYANNMRASQTPGAWWNFSSNLCTQCGIENITLDFYGTTGLVSSMNIYDCYQCWLKNIRFFWGGGRNDIYLIQSSSVVIRDSYFFQTAGSSSGGGYVTDVVETSDALIENNIYDQVDNPMIFENGSGIVTGYNFSRNNMFVNANWVIDVLPSHDSGSMMNLWEGNIFTQVSQDTQHGPSPVITYFRNRILGNQPVPNVKTEFTTPIEIQSNQRGINFIGNVLGIATCAGGTFNGQPADKNSQCVGGTLSGPSYQKSYEASPTAGTANCPNVIYMIGWPGASCAGSAGNLLSDAGVPNTMMRWGNYDTVTGGVQWNATEASPAATNFLPANFSNSYFSTLAHTLPSSLYYNSQPSWWGGANGTPAFPLIGPDVASGNLGGVAGHANENLARLCYENTAQDLANYPGTAVLKFDANNCYATGSASAPPVAAPTSLSAIVN